MQEQTKSMYREMRVRFQRIMKEENQKNQFTEKRELAENGKA
jgi:hypothetical protein